ncbi:hypothetical protein KR215_010026 [Drosophila sulfurigaster]|nr:hypothetical protein KR215_010026 [Drosophila sulfurigaster]
MLALTKSNCGKLFFLILLDFVSPLLGSLSYQQPIVEIIQNELKERPIRTLLILKRRHQSNCNLKALHTLQIPTLRKDELTTFEMKESFNSDVISVVCMTELADSILLTVLAKDLHRMRETRIIIWLQTDQDNPKKFLETICDLTKSNNFLRLMVIHSNSYDIKNKPIVYRLQPFPSPILVPIKDKIFVKTWHNFMGKTAVILNDLLPPTSMLTTDLRTGKDKLFGYSNRLISEFAKKYNISLKLKIPLSNVKKLDAIHIYRMTLNDEIDLPIRNFANTPQLRSTQVEYVSVVQLESLYVVVPCSKEISLEDVYTSLRTYFTIVLIAYFMFAILETLFMAAFYRIMRRRYRFSYLNLFMNMCAFRGVFGLGIPMSRYGSSLSLKQMVLVMSIFSLIFSSLFNANLSTLLIKKPIFRHIKNFEEFRKSDLSVVVNQRVYNHKSEFISADFYKSVISKVKIVPTRYRNDLLYSLNNSYAYQMFLNIGKPLDLYQKRYRVRFMCTSPKLIVTNVPASGILMKNSVYKIALNEYLHSTYSTGFYQHWLNSAYQKMGERFPKPNLNENQEPLRMNDLKWLWKLMGFCYAVAGIVFGGELLFFRWRGKQTRRVIIIQN